MCDWEKQKETARWVSPRSLIQSVWLSGSTHVRARRWFWKYENRKRRPHKPVSKREWNENSIFFRRKKTEQNKLISYTTFFLLHYIAGIIRFVCIISFPLGAARVFNVFDFVSFTLASSLVLLLLLPAASFNLKLLKVLKGTRQHTRTTLFGGWIAFCFLFYATCSCSYFSIHFSPIRVWQ